MSRLWIRRPLGILADDAGGGLIVDGGIIAECLPAGASPSAPVDAVFEAGEHVVLPGLINTHHHFYQTLTRAYPPALDKPLFPWLDALFRTWRHLDARMVRLAARLAIAELLLSGCTTVMDHHYLFNAELADTVDVELEEAARLGARAVITRGAMDLSREVAGFAPPSLVEDCDTILAHSERLLERRHAVEPGAMAQVALAPCSPFSVSRTLMEETAVLARRHGARLHTHLAETQDELRYCEEAFGCRTVDYLEEVGWLRDDVWLAHGIHFDVDEIRRLGAAGVGVTHCASSNQVLASGFCPVPALERSGVKVGLGVDGSASNDHSNLMQEVRQAFLLQRVAHPGAEISHRDALRWATAGSAACLGRPDLGELAVGRRADLALFKLDEPRFSGAGDPVAALVLCGAHRADRVMVEGRWVVESGAIPGLDLAALQREHSAAARRLHSHMR